MPRTKPIIHRWWGLLLLLSPMICLVAGVVQCTRRGPPPRPPTTIAALEEPTPTESGPPHFDEVLLPAAGPEDEESDRIVARYTQPDGTTRVGAFEAEDLDELWSVGPLATNEADGRSIKILLAGELVSITDASGAVRVLGLDDGEPRQDPAPRAAAAPSTTAVRAPWADAVAGAARRGKALPRLPLQGAFSLRAADTLIAVGSRPATAGAPTLAAAAIEDGTVRWSRDLPTRQGPARFAHLRFADLQRGTLYLFDGEPDNEAAPATAGGVLTAVDVDSGANRWSVELDHDVKALVAGATRLYLIDQTGGLHVLAADSGQSTQDRDSDSNSDEDSDSDSDED